ncbi:hypothetical protein ACF08M_33445 [Streptomyces sp. NPDC015032]|uniref:hypothetical protein n=1 Tax=Streptomyces sp. NPDC015032 TaxID=3364937 RepID=UPI0036FF9721
MAMYRHSADRKHAAVRAIDALVLVEHGLAEVTVAGTRSVATSAARRCSSASTISGLRPGAVKKCSANASPGPYSVITEKSVLGAALFFVMALA